MCLWDWCDQQVYCAAMQAFDGNGFFHRYAAADCQKLSKYDNVTIRRADLTQLKCRDNKYDKVVAGNVLHLLDKPVAAVKELERVCKTGGKIIIPTYIHGSSGVNRLAVRVFELAGVRFRRQFELASYQKFFEDAGYKQVAYTLSSTEECPVQWQ